MNCTICRQRVLRILQVEIERAFGLPHVAIDLPDDLDEQLLLAAEIVIDHAIVRSRRARDQIDAPAPEPALREHLHGRLKNAVARARRAAAILGARAAPRASHRLALSLRAMTWRNPRRYIPHRLVDSPSFLCAAGPGSTSWSAAGSGAARSAPAPPMRQSRYGKESIDPAASWLEFN